MNFLEKLDSTLMSCGKALMSGANFLGINQKFLIQIWFWCSWGLLTSSMDSSFFQVAILICGLVKSLFAAWECVKLDSWTKKDVLPDFVFYNQQKRVREFAFWVILPHMWGYPMLFMYVLSLLLSPYSYLYLVANYNTPTKTTLRKWLGEAWQKARQSLRPTPAPQPV